MKIMHKLMRDVFFTIKKNNKKGGFIACIYLKRKKTLKL